MQKKGHACMYNVKHKTV